MHTLILVLVLAAPPQISGSPGALAVATVHPTCDLGPRVIDAVHEEHTCPAAFSPSDCWWAWHCCEDGHGHLVRPFRNEEIACAEREGRPIDCGPASDLVSQGSCKAHVPVLIRPASVSEFCHRFPHPGC